MDDEGQLIVRLNKLSQEALLTFVSHLLTIMTVYLGRTNLRNSIIRVVGLIVEFGRDCIVTWHEIEGLGKVRQSLSLNVEQPLIQETYIDCRPADLDAIEHHG